MHSSPPLSPMSGCRENMFPALEAEAQHAHRETNREVDLRGEAEWDKWSGSSEREEKSLGARRRKLKADWPNGFSSDRSFSTCSANEKEPENVTNKIGKK